MASLRGLVRGRQAVGRQWVLATVGVSTVLALLVAIAPPLRAQGAGSALGTGTTGTQTTGAGTTPAKPPLAAAPQPGKSVKAVQSADEASAHAMAQKFADAANDAKRAEEAKKKAEDTRLKATKKAADARRKAEDAKRLSEAARQKALQLKADEVEMLARARAEAAEREEEQKRALAELERAETERQAAEDAAKAELAAREIAAKAVAEAQARLQAQTEAAARSAAEATARSDALAAQRAKDEAEQAAAAARQAEAQSQARAAAQAAAAQAAAAEAAATQAKAEAEASAAAQARAKAQAEQEADQARRAQAEADVRAAMETAQNAQRAADEHAQQKVILEAEREAEALRLTEKIRKAREAWEARQKPGRDVALGSPAQLGGIAGVQATRTPEAEPRKTRVTVLLIMSVGDRGIRRWNKTADPMLCVQETCYVSQGADTAARSMPRTTAFGPGIALGSRAGACNNALGCVFRDVDLEGAKALLQPIDLRIVRHDRRESNEVLADESCAVVGGKLGCRGVIASATWRAWIVPEDVAMRAGATALESALAAGLPTLTEASVRGDR